MVACTPPPQPAGLPQLQARSAFDLGCPYEQLRLYHFDERTKGVTGCGRRLTYVEHCERGICSWRLDTPTMAQARWPQSQPGVTATPPPAAAPVAGDRLPCETRSCYQQPEEESDVVDRGF